MAVKPQLMQVKSCQENHKDQPVKVSFAINKEQDCKEQSPKQPVSDELNSILCKISLIHCPEQIKYYECKANSLKNPLFFINHPFHTEAHGSKQEYIILSEKNVGEGTFRKTAFCWVNNTVIHLNP